MKKRNKRIAAMLLSGLMTLSLTACGQNAPAQSTDAGAGESAAAAENVELDVLSMPTNTSGLAEGWWAEEVADAVGVSINMIPCGDQAEQKLQALMASGELPDIVVFKDYTQMQNAVDGDMLLAYDDYKELLPDLYANAGTSLQYCADIMKDSDGKSYGVGMKIKTDLETKGTFGPFIRYDLYKEIGAPEIKNLDDFLTVLKQMQDLTPQNEDGQNVYAISLFKDWDRSYMTMGMFATKMMGITMPDEGSLAEIHYDSGEPVLTSILSEDSGYMQFVRFAYEANQMGILDPDSATQRFEDVVQKVTDGRVLFMLDSWGTSDFSTMEKQNNGVGFMPVQPTGYKRLVNALQPMGSSWVMSVSKSARNPEKAMEFINWYYSYEGARISQNGPRDVIWKMDESNKPVLTEKYYEINNNPEAEFSGGKTFVQGRCQIPQAFWLSSVDPACGAAVSSTYWEKPSYAPEDTALVKEWQADYGAEDMISYLMADESRIQIEPVSSYPTYTDEMEQLSGRLGDIVKTGSWKMVFAKDDAEYEQLKNQMIADAQEVGIDRFVELYGAEYEKCLADAEKYAQK